MLMGVLISLEVITISHRKELMLVCTFSITQYFHLLVMGVGVEYEEEEVRETNNVPDLLSLALVSTLSDLILIIVPGSLHTSVLS